MPQPPPNRPDLFNDACREVLEELQTFLDSECGQDLERSIRRHLGECAPCLDRADFEAELKALIANRCVEHAPAGLLEKVMAALRAAGAQLHRSDAGSGA